MHFEIKDEVGCFEGAWYKSKPGECSGQSAQACDVIGVGTGYSYREGFAPHRYIPSFFISDNNFSFVRFISIDGNCEGKEPCYNTIQEALSTSEDGDTIQVGIGVYKEAPERSTSGTVTISGGWNSSFTFQTGITEIYAPSASNGGGVKVLPNIKVISPQ